VIVNSVTHTLADAGSGKALNIINGSAEGAALSIDTAIDDIATLRAKVGTFSRGVVTSQANLSKSRGQLASALIQLRDVDAALQASSEIRERLLAAAGNLPIGFAGACPGGMLSLLA
jgi:flagellin-like hook-associated protein FlgL